MSTVPPASEPAVPSRGWKERVLGLRVTGGEGRVVVWYPAWVVTLWIALAVGGLVFGVIGLGSDGDAQAAIIGLGFGLIGTFVAWFAARPVVVADRTGIELRPAFGSRSAFRWSAIASLGVGTVRRGRTRGMAFTIVGADEEEASVDGAWLGLTTPALERIDAAVRDFARSIGATGPATAEPVVEVDEDARYH